MSMIMGQVSSPETDRGFGSGSEEETGNASHVIRVFDIMGCVGQSRTSEEEGIIFRAGKPQIIVYSITTPQRPSCGTNFVENA